MSTATTVPPAHRAPRPRAVRAGRMIERRRPATAQPAQREPHEPVIPIMRFDDEPSFIGGHLSSQMIQRNWRWW